VLRRLFLFAQDVFAASPPVGIARFGVPTVFPARPDFRCLPERCGFYLPISTFR
jgi:hypothetical protein